jgi:peptide/nickel transport system substrate-binding protein
MLSSYGELNIGSGGLRRQTGASPTEGGVKVNERPQARSRRDFLRLSAATAGVVGAASLGLQGCGSSSSTTTTQPGSTSRPRRGGNLRVGLTGGSSTDTLDPDATVTVPDIARQVTLFEPLVTQNAQDRPALDLAEEITADNASATSWTVRLHKGIHFHNGKELTAEDVLFTFSRILNPKKPLNGALSLSPVDLKGVKILDRYTIRVPMTRPYASFVSQLYGGYDFIVPVGFDPRAPVGTGPFKFKSFTPGVQSVFVRNDDYWKAPFPYVDELTIVEFADGTSQVNALLSAVVDAIGNIPLTVATEIASTSGLQLLDSKSAAYNPFTMRVDQAPFNDVRVRQAMRLLINRQEMIDLAYDGHAVVGNDVFGIADPDYDTSLVRHQDLDQARSLLRAAGRSDLSVNLVTGPISNGVVESATVFAQQAKLIGVNVTVTDLPTTSFYGPAYLQRPFSQDIWYPSTYLVLVAQETLGNAAPFNETHFNDPAYNRLYAEANNTLDPVKERDIVHEMMRIDFDTGGLIIPSFNNNLDAFSDRVKGFEPNFTGIPLSRFGFAQVWFD